MNRNNAYCYVLSGGGAKGVYHIGVWKALKELGIRVEAFVGNSIGAILGAFLAQGLDAELEEIGSSIGLNYILNVPDELIENGELKLSMTHHKAFRKFYKSFSARKGLDTAPLRDLLESYIDESAIRGGRMDLGVVTVNVSDLKPREVFLEDMEGGQLINYVLASSAFPGFQSPEIAGKKYVDGGLYDNIPYSMAKARGYRNIIVADISGLGVTRRPEIEGCRTVYIRNSVNMGGILDFNRRFLDDFTRLGYLDTMKTFGEFRGKDFFFQSDASSETAFGRLD